MVSRARQVPRNLVYFAADWRSAHPTLDEVSRSSLVSGSCLALADRTRSDDSLTSPGISISPKLWLGFCDECRHTTYGVSRSDSRSYALIFRPELIGKGASPPVANQPAHLAEGASRARSQSVRSLQGSFAQLSSSTIRGDQPPLQRFRRSKGAVLIYSSIARRCPISRGRYQVLRHPPTVRRRRRQPRTSSSRTRSRCQRHRLSEGSPGDAPCAAVTIGASISESSRSASGTAG